MIKDLINPYLNIFDYRGKSSIKEFWTFYIATFLLIIILSVVGKRILGIENLHYYLIGLNFFPMLALGFRRMNDVGINKWLFLLPIAGVYLAALPAKGEELK